MAWRGLVGCLPSGLREVHDLPSYFPSRKGQGIMGVSGNLVRDGGEGLVPQGRALIKQRAGVTDRPRRRDGEGSERGQRAEGGPCRLLNFQKEKRKRTCTCLHGCWGQGCSGNRKRWPQAGILHPQLIFPGETWGPSLSADS